MTTSRTISTAVALATLALAPLGAKSGVALPSAAAAPGSAYTVRDERTVRPGAPAAQPQRYAYRWPLKPFGRQHPVRAFFGDPRIANHGRTRQFHFGIDISAPNGTPVYATRSPTLTSVTPGPTPATVPPASSPSVSGISALYSPVR